MSLGSRAAGAGGALLGSLTRALAAVRPARKPLHPRGRVRHGQLHRRGLRPPVGVDFLDRVAVDDVLARESRSVGLPEGWPDVQGLALRVTTASGDQGDLLLGSAGLGRLTRFALVPVRSPYARPLSTLLPFRTTAGPVQLAVTRTGPDRLEVLCAVGLAGEWRSFADLRLSGVDAADVSFEPVHLGLPGLTTYDWVRRLRAPAYARARASRGEDETVAVGEADAEGRSVV